MIDVRSVADEEISRAAAAVFEIPCNLDRNQTFLAVELAAKDTDLVKIGSSEVPVDQQLFRRLSYVAASTAASSGIGPDCGVSEALLRASMSLP